MKQSLGNTLMTIKFFLLSMLILSILMSLMVGWGVFRLIQALPKNNSESLKVEEISMLSSDVEKIYGECLAGIDWVKTAKVDPKTKIEECLSKSQETESYKRLKSVYDVEVLPLMK